MFVAFPPNFLAELCHPRVERGDQDVPRRHKLAERGPSLDTTFLLLSQVGFTSNSHPPV